MRPDAEAYLTIVPRAVECTDSEFVDLWNFGMDPAKVARTKFMGSEIKRIQGTFGADYKFGSQKTQNLGPVDKAPAAVRRCWECAQRAAQSSFGMRNPAAVFTGAHCNWYKGGEAWLDMHRDEEVDEQKGVPIFSFTLLRRAPSAREATANFRCFAVDYRDGQCFLPKEKPKAGAGAKKGAKKAKQACTFNIPMRDGTLIVMSGRDFQSTFVHGVPKTTAAKFADVWRINVTIRAWSGATAVRDGKRSKQGATKK